MKYDGTLPIVLDKNDKEKVHRIAQYLNDTRAYGKIDLETMFRDDNDSPTVYVSYDSIRIFSTVEGSLKIGRIFITDSTFYDILRIMVDRDAG